MELQVRKEGDVVILDLSGKVMNNDDTALLRNEVKQQVEDGTRKLVLNMSELQWMNSSGLGVLVAATSTVQNVKGVMKLAGTPEKIMSLFRITRLEQVFDFRASVEEALESF